MAVVTYDPKKFVIILGAHIATGFADGTFIQIERASDTFTKTVGAGGDVARAKSNDRSGRVTLTLMNTSPTNDFLSGQALADELDNSGKFVFSATEIAGTTVIQGSEAWVVKPSAIQRSKNIDTTVWAIDIAQMNVVVGSLPVDAT
jgi:hypothetical protein